MDDPITTEPVTSSPLVAAMSDLEKCHRDHVRYYTSSPRERAPVLRQHADSLLGLADQASAARAPDSFSTLRSDLALIAAETAENGAWLEAAMETSWDAADSLIALDEFADVLAERHQIIANDWQAALLDGLAAKLLRRALDILEALEVASGAERDPGDAGVSVYRLRAAAALIGRAAALLREAATLGSENEHRWAVVRSRMRELAAVEGVRSGT